MLSCATNASCKIVNETTKHGEKHSACTCVAGGFRTKKRRHWLEPPLAGVSATGWTLYCTVLPCTVLYCTVLAGWLAGLLAGWLSGRIQEPRVPSNGWTSCSHCSLQVSRISMWSMSRSGSSYTLLQSHRATQPQRSQQLRSVSPPKLQQRIPLLRRFKMSQPKLRPMWSQKQRCLGVSPFLPLPPVSTGCPQTPPAVTGLLVQHLRWMLGTLAQAITKRETETPCKHQLRLTP